jgi:hypothetical protein
MVANLRLIPAAGACSPEITIRQLPEDGGGP